MASKRDSKAKSKHSSKSKEEKSRSSGVGPNSASFAASMQPNMGDRLKQQDFIPRELSPDVGHAKALLDPDTGSYAAAAVDFSHCAYHTTMAERMSTSLQQAHLVDGAYENDHSTQQSSHDGFAQQQSVYSQNMVNTGGSEHSMCYRYLSNDPAEQYALVNCPETTRLYTSRDCQCIQQYDATLEVEEEEEL